MWNKLWIFHSLSYLYIKGSRRWTKKKKNRRVYKKATDCKSKKKNHLNARKTYSYLGWKDGSVCERKNVNDSWQKISLGPFICFDVRYLPNVFAKRWCLAGCKIRIAKFISRVKKFTRLPVTNFSKFVMLVCWAWLNNKVAILFLVNYETRSRKLCRLFFNKVQVISLWKLVKFQFATNFW